MTIRGNPRSYHKKFAFVIEVEGIGFTGFNKCSELEAEIAKIEQWEGGRLTPDKSPGRVTVSDLTLERGATLDTDLYAWWLDVVRMSANSGLTDDAYKRDAEVIQLDRDGSVVRRWSIAGAWPTKFVAGAWDNDADENVVEMLVLTLDTFDLIPAGAEAA